MSRAHSRARRRSRIATSLGALGLLLAGPATGDPPDDFAAIAREFLAEDLATDWHDLEQLPGIAWAPLPPVSLANCLPNGACFTRQGTATLGATNFSVVAGGARTIVVHLGLRSSAAPLSAAAVLAASRRSGLTAELVRCPIHTDTSTIDWYRLRGSGPVAGILAIRAAIADADDAELSLSRGEELPPLQPAQLTLYSEHCGPGEDRQPVSMLKPHELLAQTVATLLRRDGNAAYDWHTLARLPTGITWFRDGPQAMDSSIYGDSNPVGRTGVVAYAGRKFSVLAAGTPTEVRSVYLDELGVHPRGEHLLGVVYEKGITVRLVRCGPVYTESTNNWYSLTSEQTRPAMVRQSIRYDGDQVQESYALRLDGSLPSRDPRDRDPGVNGC